MMTHLKNTFGNDVRIEANSCFIDTICWIKHPFSTVVTIITLREMSSDTDIKNGYAYLTVATQQADRENIILFSNRYDTEDSIKSAHSKYDALVFQFNGIMHTFSNFYMEKQ